MAKTTITAPIGFPTIEITREFDAPRDLIFRAHTDPELLLQWLGPRDLMMTIDHFDVQHGGTWRYTHRDANGNEYGFHGVFHGTPSVDGIVQTWEFEGMPGHVSLERATFEERGGRTLLRQFAVYQSVEDRDGLIASGMEGGVNDSMDRLDDLVTRMVPVTPRAG